MMESTSADLTIRDVLNGLESMEKWTRQLREALASLDQDQRLHVQPPGGVAKDPPLVSGGQCPPKKKKKTTPKKK